ncbi:unnamed protein product, partial [Staurois parvus]
MRSEREQNLNRGVRWMWYTWTEGWLWTWVHLDRGVACGRVLLDRGCCGVVYLDRGVAVERGILGKRGGGWTWYTWTEGCGGLWYNLD